MGSSKLTNLALAVALCACTGARDRSVGDFADPAAIEVEPGDFYHLWSYAAGSFYQDHGRAVVAHPSGDVLLLGTIHGESSLGSVPISTSLSEGGSLLARIRSTNGSVLWARTFESIWILAVTASQTGELFLAARSDLTDTTFEGFSIPADSCMLLAMSEDGTLTMAKSVASGAFCDRISVSPNGDLFVAGKWLGAAGAGAVVDAAPPQETTVLHGFVARLTHDGDLLWRKDIATSAFDSVAAMKPTATGVVIAGLFGGSDFTSPPLYVDGHVLDNPGRAGAFVISLDSDGLWEWGHAFGGAEGENVADLALGDDGSIYVAGSFRGDATLPTGDVFTDVPNGNSFVFRLSQDGTPLSHTLVRCQDGVQLPSLATGPNGVYLAGNSERGNVRVGDFEVPASPHDMFVAQLSPSLDLLWLRAFSGEEDGALESASSIAFMGGSRVALTGHFDGANQPARLDLGGDVLKNHGESDLFVGLLELQLPSQ